MTIWYQMKGQNLYIKKKNCNLEASNLQVKTHFVVVGHIYLMKYVLYLFTSKLNKFGQQRPLVPFFANQCTSIA